MAEGNESQADAAKSKNLNINIGPGTLPSPSCLLRTLSPRPPPPALGFACRRPSSLCVRTRFGAFSQSCAAPESWPADAVERVLEM